MKAFYKIENNQAQVGSGEFIPDGFTEFEAGQEPEELVLALEAEKVKQDIDKQIAEAKQYLDTTGWIWEKYNRNVLILKDLTDEDFKVKYQDIITKQEEARALINQLENN